MATNYPGSLDNFTNPTSASPINSPSHADQHSNANDAIEALESKVGSNNSVVTTSHDYKIAQLESLVTSSVAGAKSIYQDVRNQSGSPFIKATPVYVSGSVGASGKILISAASNASEATSSKTMGITTSAISNNSNGQIISEGILEGIDTTGAADGDPVWLGVDGVKIYGLANKPSAPAHLVFLGIVIRGGQANTGSMYVKIQNGFELQELHNVEISSLLNGNILAYDSSTSTWKNTNTLQSTSSTVPLVIKGATSQTANLQEWQDTTGAVKALVGSGGNAVFNGIRSGSGSTTAAINAYTTAAQIGILVKGAVSQTANLQEWQDSTGAVNASLTSNGEFRIANIFAITSYNNAQVNMLSTGARITTNVAANVTLTVKGAASQTADLQQWQDSAGTVLTRINSAGNVYTSGYLTAGVQSPTGTLTVVSKGVSVPVAVIKGAASQTANLQEWQNSAGTILAYIDKDGQILTPRVNLPANGLIVEGGTGPYIQMGSSATYLYTRSASNKGLVIQGSISQTANLQEWQDPYGGVKASFDNNGRYNLNAVYGSNFYGRLNVAGSSSDGYALDVGTINGNTPGVAQRISLNNNSDIGLIITGYGSYQHTGDLLRIDGTKGDGGGDFFRVNASGAVQAYSATQKGLTVKGFASQTANLQEWQNSAGTVLSKIDATGNAQFAGFNVQNSATINGTIYTQAIGSTSDYAGNAISINSGKAVVMTPAAASVGLVIKGAASQTANLQEWQNNSGTTLARVNQFGDFYITGGRIFRGNQDLGANLNILNESDLKGIVVKAVSGQTKNLTELQSSTGAVLSGINPIGQLFIRSTTPITAAAGSQAITSVSFTSTTATYTFSATEQTISIGEYVTVFGITPSGYNGTYQVTSVATVSAGSSYSFTVANTTNDTVTVGTGYFFPSASVSISTQNKAHTGLIIKAVSGQTSSVMEIQNSLGQPATWWDSAGGMTASMTVVSTLYSGGFMNTGTLGYFNATTFSPSVRPIVVRGAASQTANLQEWQNSSGTVLANVDSSGNIYTSSTTIWAGYNRAANGAALYNFTTVAGATYAQAAITRESGFNGNLIIGQQGTGAVLVQNGSASAIGLIVKGTASQSASLQEWQNSSGTMLASITDTGFSTAILKIPYIYTYVIQGWNGVGGSIEFANATPITIKPQSASVVNLAIKGAVSQTADLQQWQDSAGTALAGIGPNGRIYAQGKTGNTDDLLYLRRADNNIYMYVDKDATLRGNFGIRINQEPSIDTQAFMWSGTSSRSALGVSGTGSTNPTFYAKATASQTSNLTEWQDSSGTAMSYIKPDGSLNFTANSNAVLISGTSTSGLNRIISNGNDLFFSPYFDGLFAPAVSSGRWRPANDATSDLGSSGQRWKDLYATSGILTNNSISKVGLIVKAIASQTANLQEWQDSTGAVKASIRSSGGLSLNNANSIRLHNTANTDYASLWMDNGSGGTNLYVKTNYPVLMGDVGVDTGASLTVATQGASQIGQVIRGFTSQTANLQQWQNSIGTVLTKIDSAGRITISPDSTGSNLLTANGSTTTFSVSQFGSINVIGTATSSFGSLFTGTQVGINGSSSIGLIIKGGASADMQQWQNVGGTVVAKVDKDGNITAADLTLSGNLTVNGTTTNLNSVNLVIEDKNIIIADVATPTDTTADGAGITIKGATDKTFNWVQSTGRFTSSEPIQSSAFVSTYVYASQVGSTVIGSATLNTNSDTGGLLINTAGAANKGLSIRGAASQTANLTQWQDSGGNILTRVQADGTISWGTGTSALQNSSGRLIVNPSSASAIAVIVKGAVSQTANLQEWQNSDAVSVAQISATGTVSIRPVGFSGNLNTAIISVTDRASTWTPGNFAFRSDSNGIPRFSFTAPNAPSEALSINGNSVGVQTPSPTSVFQVTSNGAGNTVSIIKGAVSQTANLQEWQNSAGYAGTAIDSSGSFYAPGIYSSYLMQATAGGAAVVPLTVKGVTSQTANLTEWKDSAGNAQAYVRYDGFINTNSSIRIAGDNLSVYRFQGVSDGNYTMNFPGSGNIQLFSATDSLGGGSKVLGISNATTVPSSNPTGGGILYVNSGSLVYRGAGGAITTIARSGNESSTISLNTATTVDTVALSSFTTIEYTISIKQGSKVRSSKVLVHTDGTSVDSTEYGIIEMGGGITGIIVTASVSSTNSILQVTITDASTTNATVKIIKTML